MGNWEWGIGHRASAKEGIENWALKKVELCLFLLPSIRYIRGANPLPNFLLIKIELGRRLLLWKILLMRLEQR